MVPDDEDKKVKDMLGETSLADLERWFGLPSFTELEEKGVEPPRPEDPDIIAIRERRERALAAIEPWFLDGLNTRAEKPWTLIRFKPIIDVKVRLDMEMMDQSMIDGLRVIAEPRERERPENIEDDLRERTPQALLRDLHRVESFFEKTYEIYDAEAMERLDATAQVAEAMAADWKLPPLGDPPSVELTRIFAEVRQERTLPWRDLPKRNRLPNRRVSE
ncbi:MAG: hypothetical protein H0T46_26275 [Deltaproteobacteria bacterium]|nr:hypothetical protein [Deltaproteobacteria bacterium]